MPKSGRDRLEGRVRPLGIQKVDTEGPFTILPPDVAPGSEWHPTGRRRVVDWLEASWFIFAFIACIVMGALIGRAFFLPGPIIFIWACFRCVRKEVLIDGVWVKKGRG